MAFYDWTRSTPSSRYLLNNLEGEHHLKHTPITVEEWNGNWHEIGLQGNHNAQLNDDILQAIVKHNPRTIAAGDKEAEGFKTDVGVHGLRVDPVTGILMYYTRSTLISAGIWRPVITATATEENALGYIVSRYWGFSHEPGIASISMTTEKGQSVLDASLGAEIYAQLIKHMSGTDYNYPCEFDINENPIPGTGTVYETDLNPKLLDGYGTYNDSGILTTMAKGAYENPHRVCFNEKYEGALASQILGEIEATQIPNGIITAEKIAAGAITAASLEANSIGTEHIKDKAITEAKLANNSVGTAQLKDNSVTTSKLVNGAVTIAKGGTGATTVAQARTNLGIPAWTSSTWGARDTLVTRSNDYAISASLITSSVDGLPGYTANNLTLAGRDTYGNNVWQDNKIVLAADNTSGYLAHYPTYERTYSGSANMRVTSNGVFGYVGSAKRYKEDIKDAVIDEDLILNLRPRDWIDKGEKARTIAALKNDKVEEGYDISPKQWYEENGWSVETLPRHVGLVAEEVEALTGGEMFVEYNDAGEVNGLMYDRLIVAAAATIQKQQKQIDELISRIEALEG